MAGSYKHLVAEDGTFTFDLIENMGDAYEACEECFDKITAIREQLREAREGLIQTHEEDQEYTVTFTQELREELAEVREQLREQGEIKAELQRLLKEGAATVRRLTDALSCLAHNVINVDVVGYAALYREAKRALAEMGMSGCPSCSYGDD